MPLGQPREQFGCQSDLQKRQPHFVNESKLKVEARDNDHPNPTEFGEFDRVWTASVEFVQQAKESVSVSAMFITVVGEKWATPNSEK